MREEKRRERERERERKREREKEKRREKNITNTAICINMYIFFSSFSAHPPPPFAG